MDNSVTGYSSGLAQYVQSGVEYTCVNFLILSYTKCLVWVPYMVTSTKPLDAKNSLSLF